METGWLQLAERKASKRQRQMLHRFLGLYSGHPELVGNLSELDADALLAVFNEYARQWHDERARANEETVIQAV